MVIFPLWSGVLLGDLNRFLEGSMSINRLQKQKTRETTETPQDTAAQVINKRFLISQHFFSTRIILIADPVPLVQKGM